MYNNSARNIIFPLVVAAAAIGGILFGQKLAAPLPGAHTGGRAANRTAIDNKLSYTLGLIEHHYVDSVNMDSLTDNAITLLLEELDPHSTYIPASLYSSANENLEGQFDGIGVVFNMMGDTVRIINVISNGPSDNAGVRNGDRIIKINDTLVAGQKIDQNDIVKKLRGKRGSKVELSLQRFGIADLVDVTVTRGVIPVKSLDAAFMIEPGIGFIKLSAFSQNSLKEITEALARLKEQGMKKLIFDLRGNSGGYLEQAVYIANEFLADNTLIEYTVNRVGKKEERYSNGRGRYTDLDLVILVDEGSASSSEILAGAIQDNDRGTIIGRRTFGKGLVQEQFNYKDGSALRLTIARYYTPTGRSLQKPYDLGSDEYGMDLYNRYAHSELFSADSIQFSDSLKFTTPAGRTVYGGGGIMPDIFVPLDTSRMNRYYTEVYGRNIMNRFVIEFTDKHREEINAIATIGEMNTFLDRQRNLLSDFVSYASREGVPADWTQIAVATPVLKAQLRAYIARNSSLEDNGFYSNIYPIDNTLLKALEVLNND